MGNRVAGKVAIVTGAGSTIPGMGNGKASAILYAREGASVVLVDFNLAAAEDTRSIIESEGGRAVTIQADVAKSDHCKRVVDFCIETFGKVDILHNNVGITIPKGVVETSEEEWEKIIAVNVRSMYLMCKHTIPHMMRAGSGSIVNVSSVASIRSGSVTATAYGTSKGAVNAFTREVAIEYARYGIRANAVLPGLIKTPMVQAQLTEGYGGDVEKMWERRDSVCPTGKQGEPWDIAYAALYLASDESKYVTAVMLPVDGGLSARIF